MRISTILFPLPAEVLATDSESQPHFLFIFNNSGSVWLRFPDMDMGHVVVIHQTTDKRLHCLRCPITGGPPKKHNDNSFTAISILEMCCKKVISLNILLMFLLCH